MEVDQPWLEVQLLRRAVPDGVFEAVAAQVTIGVLFGPEGIERVFVGSIPLLRYG